MRIIDCDQCAMQHTEVCADCVVSFVLSREPGEALVIDADEERAVRAMQRAGLLPDLRHRSRQPIGSGSAESISP
jgi:hypothetical protein